MFGKIVFLSILTLFSLHLYTIYDFLEINKVIVNLHPSKCYSIKNIKSGAEDIRIIPDTGFALVTAGLFPFMQPNIYLIDLNSADPIEASEVMTFDDSYDIAKFHPHGGFIWSKPGAKPRYFVINHHDDFEAVDVFDIDVDARKLHHVKRITDPTMRNMNALVVTDGDSFSFYFSNWLGGRTHLINVLQKFLMFPAGDVCYYSSNGGGRVVAKNLFVPNGLAISLDKKFLYVANSKFISLYSILGGDSGAIDFVRQYSFKEYPDNLDLHFEQGDAAPTLWYAGPANLLQASLKLAGIDRVSPVASLVSYCTINTVDGTLSDPKQFLVDDGKLVSSGSMAVRYENRVLIGTVDGTLTICQI